MTELHSVSASLESLCLDAQAKAVAPIEKLPVELLAHIFSFVDSVSQKRLERVCQLWKDFVRSHTVRAVAWFDIGPEWLGLFRPGRGNPYRFLKKLVSSDTRKIIFSARVGCRKELLKYLHYTGHIWTFLDKENRDGKPVQKIILKNVFGDFASLFGATVRRNLPSWSLEGVNIHLAGISSDMDVKATENDYFGPGFTLAIDSLKLNFVGTETPEERCEKIWAAIEANCTVSSNEMAMLENHWGDRMVRSETVKILRLREPLYRVGVKNLSEVNGRTLKPCTLRQVVACMREWLEGTDDQDDYSLLNPDDDEFAFLDDNFE